ncbi:hypothetical protein [Aquimarina sp. Aq107]|uniref:hypothetical protein n=1 Tax=Aquimarina sp. Aq107 TaxID=1191912 RepID=UPI000D54F0B6|nr:hypothetical protein [Aquimarina sp. Aq107]
MNKILLLIITIFSIQLISAQRTYTFDYMIGFTSQRSLNMPINMEVALINSKNNDYHLLVVNDGSLEFKFHFIDHKIGFQTIFYLEKEAFLKANRINLDCDYVKKIRTPKWNRKYAGKYFFENLKDTIINDTAFNHIVMKKRAKKNKRLSRRKKLDLHFITYKDKKFDMPFIANHYIHISWEQLVDKENFNFDIIKEQYSIKDNKKEWIYKFVEVNKIENKYISVPEACDYSN